MAVFGVEEDSAGGDSGDGVDAIEVEEFVESLEHGVVGDAAAHQLSGNNDGHEPVVHEHMIDASSGAVERYR